MRELEGEDGAGAGPRGGADQAHAGLAGGAAPFADVALQAGADDVLPGRPAAPAAGEDVIEAQLGGGEPLAAVLAAVAVAGEDVAAVELDLVPGQAVVGQQADDAGDLDLEVDGADEVVVGVLEPGAGLGDL